MAKAKKKTGAADPKRSVYSGLQSLRVEERAIGSIKPYPNNPRKNDHAVAAVAKSIEEFGFRQPIVVDTLDVIIVGHTRYKAALRLGLDVVPVHVADLPPEKARAYRLADNATNELAEWDADLLPIELNELQSAGVDVAALGFAPGELERFLKSTASATHADPDAIPTWSVTWPRRCTAAASESARSVRMQR